MVEKSCLGMNTRSATECTIFSSAQIFSNWREQRPSNQGYFDWRVAFDLIFVPLQVKQHSPHFHPIFQAMLLYRCHNIKTAKKNLFLEILYVPLGENLDFGSCWYYGFMTLRIEILTSVFSTKCKQYMWQYYDDVLGYDAMETRR